ncbi:hypothetical protein DSA37_13205 [Salmonella enterica]|nr:hypothetical protein [Salmonella enterica]
MNGVEPEGWLCEVIGKINDWSSNWVHELSGKEAGCIFLCRGGALWSATIVKVRMPAEASNMATASLIFMSSVLGYWTVFTGADGSMQPGRVIFRRRRLLQRFIVNKLYSVSAGKQ